MAKGRTTQPVAPAREAKPEKPKRVPFPHAKPLTEVPTSFDSAKHSPLKRKDFGDEAIYFELQANRHDVAARKFRGLAEESRQFGDSKQRKMANRLVKMREKMAELETLLETRGVDLSAIETLAAKKAKG